LDPGACRKGGYSGIFAALADGCIENLSRCKTFVNIWELVCNGGGILVIMGAGGC